MSVYLAGRGLSCALGRGLGTALAALHDTTTCSHVDLGAFGSFPYAGIPLDMDNWYTRARLLVEEAAHEAGGQTIRHAPLFIASSSIDIGAFEPGTDAPFPYCGALAQRIAGWLDWRGPVFTIATACTSSINALLSAQRMMTAQDTDDALILGVELANTFTLRGFAAMQLLSAHAAHPFGAGRDGLVLGETVAALRLSRTPARWRLRGGANVVDGKDPAGASHAAIIHMVNTALAQAGLGADNIGLIKVQAAGSPANDATEARALHEIFGANMPLTSFKHLIGHTLGASGAAELALLTACLETGQLPHAHYPFDTALACKLADSLPDRPRYVLANILGFGGGHATLVLADETMQ